jgi:hypothetical protein
MTNKEPKYLTLDFKEEKKVPPPFGKIISVPLKDEDIMKMLGKM